MSSSTGIRYELCPFLTTDWNVRFEAHVERLIERAGATVVCDLGGGGDPVLSADVVAARGLRYVIIDVDHEQLRKVPDGYELLHWDLLGAPPPDLRCDLAISRFVLEHLDRPSLFHENVRAMLQPGGQATHFFPTLYALPFALNSVIPEALSGRVVRRMFPAREPEGKHPKFPAHYRWCRGPTAKQIDRFRSVGFEVEEYVGYFGHPYFQPVPRLQAAEEWLARTLVAHPLPTLTTFARVTLRPSPT